MRLTGSQEKAVTSGLHLSVTANAGSGKTTVLIERYVKLLEDLIEGKVREDVGDVVDGIVVITFTEKAASELKERATKAIEQKIQEARDRNDLKKLEKLEELRDAMPSAVIGTIHSFCARILREFAILARVDPNFTILEGAQREQAIDIIIEEKLKEFLNRGDDSANRLFEIIEKMKIGNFYRFIKKLISSRELVEKVKRDIYLAMSDDEIISMWRDKIFNYVFNVFEESQIKKALISLAGHLFEDDLSFKDIASRFEEAIKRRDVVDAYKNLCEAREKIFTKDLKVRKKVLEKSDKKSLGVKKTTSHLIELLGKVYQSVAGLKLDEFDEFVEAHRQYVRDTRLILSLYDEINAEYENFKFASGYLDFEDLQLKVSRLLENEEIRDELSRRFSYIMIDEYQDTNYLQYEIVKKLIKDFAGDVKIFVVGDDKQSIYGFRGSEVEVFDKTRREIKEAGRGEEIYLSESFRLLRGIAGLVNFIFGKIMGERISIHEVAYNPIVVGREEDDDGIVEILLVRKDSVDENSRRGRHKLLEAEAKFVAKRIASLLQDENAYVYRDGNKKRVEPRDIAVLIRNRNVLRAIENAFIEVNIPYIVSSGIGFYQTQEIYDFMNYLEFIINTNNDVALVGILRAPFFGISDAEIFRVSVYGSGVSFWDKLCDYVRRDREPMASDKLKRAVKILSEDLKIANRMSIPSLIQRIMVNTMYNGSTLPMRRGEQINANIQKLIGIARDFEARGFNNLYDFVEQLRFLSEEHLREGQASVQIGVDAVQVMTIHSAKGLEFPIVVLPFLGETFKARKREKFNIDVDYGIGLGVEYGDEGLPINSVHELIRQHKSEAEEKRVLYVAMTRARDMLILSGVYEREDSKDTYLNLILNPLDIWADVDQSVTFETDVKFKDGSEQRREFKVRIYRFGRDFTEPVEFLGGRSDVVKIDEEKIFTKSLESRPYGEFFTATQLQTFSLCPMKFYLKFRLGLPESWMELVAGERLEDVTAPPYEDDSKDEIVGTFKGRVVHEVFEILKGEVDDRKLRDVISVVLHRNGISNEKKFKALESYVFDEVKKVLNSKFGRRIFSADEHYIEYGISMRFGDVYLMGKIDRLYRVNGEWEIVDFKTDDIDLSKIECRKEEYEVQLGVYSYLLSKLKPGQGIFRSYILFTKFPDNPVEVVHTSGTLEGFEKKLLGMISQIKELDLNPNLSPSSDFKEHCRRCGYFSSDKCIGSNSGADGI